MYKQSPMRRSRRSPKRLSISNDVSAPNDRCSSASLDRRSENVRVLPVIIAELEFCNIKRHIFSAHFVERADDAALEDRPDPLDGLSVNCADDILPLRMVNSHVRVILIERIVAGILIGTKQADFMRHRFADEGGESIGVDIRDHARNHIALAANSADDRSFAGTDTAGSAAAAAFIPMPVFGQAADECFIDLDNAAEFVDVFHKRDANAMTHIPSSFQRTEPHITPNLASTYSLFAGEHQMNDAIPIAERLIGVFENRASKMGETICAALAAIRALPVPFHGFEVISPLASAARAADAFRPALADKIGTTSFFVWKHRLELGNAHLMDLRWLFCSGHDDLSFVRKTVA
jgi:hypothetical protein